MRTLRPSSRPGAGALPSLAALALAALLGGCSSSTPAPTCPAGQTSCNGTCFDLSSSEFACGVCGNACATGASCQAGTCTCPAAAPDLCGGPGGQCVDLQSDLFHCGGCSVYCGLGSCAGGACACQAGTTTCAGDGTRCVDLTNDTSNCGTCRNGCALGEPCKDGVCTCDPPKTKCPYGCIDLASHPTNCGSCGHTCAVGQTCVAGVCGCPAGQSLCGGRCVTTASDPTACGPSCLRCPAGAACVAGQCRCPAGETTCGAAPGTCADLASDPDFCGNCTTACTGSAVCTLGTCCAPGLLACAPPGGGAKACCAGTGCCASGCQTAHSNGLGQAYYDCGTLGTLSRPAAQAAAASWAPAGGTDYDLPNCGGGCFARQTNSACAAWCYDGLWAGRVELNTISVACLCPTGLSPTWN